jgi:hypothetical protein
VWHAVWPKKAHFPPYFTDFFDRIAATACKNLLRLAKNGHFLTTLTSYDFPESGYKILFTIIVPHIIVLSQNNFADI